MKVLSAADATLLALIAENPRMPGRELDKLLSRLDTESQEIARAIVRVDMSSTAAENVHDPISATAKSILNWVRGNKRRETTIPIPA